MKETLYTSDICTSDLQVLWISLLYVLKSMLLLLGAYFTHQTRHVTLQTLKDTREVFTVVFIVVAMGMICLPVILVSRVGHVIKYATASLVLLIVLGASLTLSFLPKVRKTHC